MGERALDGGTGPRPRLLATWPAPGEGTDCAVDAPDDCGVPRDAAVQLRFDRLLDPATATRPSIKIYSGTEARRELVDPLVDPLERVATFRAADGAFDPGVLYTVEVLVPEPDDEFAGFRAFDGAPLDPDGPAPLVWSFRTRRADPVDPPARAPLDCAALLSTFVNGCVGGECHGSPGRMGLDLNPEGVALAIGRIARSTALSGDTVTPLTDPHRFGLSMPLIERARPDNSFLYYKLLVNPENYQDDPDAGAPCTSPWQVPLEAGGPSAEAGAAPCAPFVGEEEAARLRQWFVPGAPMPRPFEGKRPLTRPELDRIARWIREGAPTVGCLE